MKFLLLVIGLIWTHYGNASSYFLNGEPLIFDKGQQSFCFSQGNGAALRMSDNNIEFIIYKSNSDSETPYSMFGEGLSGISRNFSLPDPHHIFTGGSSYEFYMTVFDNAESITFEAPDKALSLKGLVISRSVKGSIGLCGSLDFMKPFECMKGSLSSSILSSYFLIEGADIIELYL